MIEVPLTQGKVALIDDEDAERVLTYKWTLCAIPRPNKTTYYARRGTQRGGKNKTILLHRFILDAPDGLQVDHINGDSLDNRRSNLRLATNAQNHCNMPATRPNQLGFRGIETMKDGRQFKARIKVEGQIIRIGPFSTPEDAARGYDLMAKHYHGEFATLNFPDE